jgi:hypothetical protein
MVIFGDSDMYKHGGSGQQSADTEQESCNSVEYTRDEDDAYSDTVETMR